MLLIFNIVKKGETGDTCSMHMESMKHVQNFGWVTQRKETPWAVCENEKIILTASWRLGCNICIGLNYLRQERDFG